MRDANVLTLNSGSSSLKFGLYRTMPLRTEMLLTGEVEEIGGPAARLHGKDACGNLLPAGDAPIADHNQAIVQVGKMLGVARIPALAAIGHRIVHGGPKLRRHCVIDDEVLEQLEAATVFAPLHMPPALSVIRFAREHFPGIPQVACFDTTFHADLPSVARTLPLPKALRLEGIQRYGFHGLSCESILRQLGDAVPDRLVVAHLGNGASITAVKNGESVDTSMGLTPVGGVIMGTRSGDLDPGILLYLMRKKNIDVAALEDLVNRHCGLLGVSGVGSDMRELWRAAPSNPDAKLAIDMFCYAVRKQIAALIAVLGGVDLLVFTGGIGENDERVRDSICGGLAWLGSDLLHKVRVLPSREDEQIARHTETLLSQRERLS